MSKSGDFLKQAAIELLRSDQPLRRQDRETIARLLEGPARGRPKAGPVSLTEQRRRAEADVLAIETCGMKRDDAIGFVVTTYRGLHGINLNADQMKRELDKRVRNK